MQGSEVTIDYDPILAKLVVWGENRDYARARMIKALHEYKILGIRHSIRYLADIVAHPKFASGETYTDFVPKNLADWSDGAEENVEFALAAAAVMQANKKGKAVGGIGSVGRIDHNPWLTSGNWRIGEGAR
jgi:3-methylcrotonyl-CoA carboxylase alpha subunit